MRKIAAFVSMFTVVALSAAAFAATQTVTLSSPVVVGAYEVRNADRGVVRRVKVFHEGRLITTIVLRRGDASSYCCTQDSCRKLDAPAACTTLKMSCDAERVCSVG